MYCWYSVIISQVLLCCMLYTFIVSCFVCFFLFLLFYVFFFFFSSRRRHTRSLCDWSSDVCSSDLPESGLPVVGHLLQSPSTASWTLENRLATAPRFWATCTSHLVGKAPTTRSEERRVGKECRTRRETEH